MNRSTRRLLQSGSAAFAVLALGLAAPTVAHATTPAHQGLTAHTSAPAKCPSHRRPVAIAPRMIDKASGRSQGPRHCR